MSSAVKDYIWDPSTKRGAEQNIEILRDYWYSRGYFGVMFEIVEATESRGHKVFSIRSNIGPDGFPPKGRVADLPLRK